MNVIVRNNLVGKLLLSSNVILNGIRAKYNQKIDIRDTDSIEIKITSPFIFRVNSQKIDTTNATLLEVVLSINIQKFIFKNLVSFFIVLFFYFGVLKFYPALSVAISVIILFSLIYSNFISSILWKVKIDG